MVRTKTKKAAIVSTSLAPPPPPTTTSLIAKAQDLITQCDYDLALRFIRRALDQEPTNPDAREVLGIIEIERGELENAQKAFLSLVPPSSTAPNPPPASAYLYLAQINDEDPRIALGYYQSAVDLLQGQLKRKERAKAPAGGEAELDSDNASETRRTIVRALVGMVEIWMSDLCFEPTAEESCDALLALALEVDPKNAEAFQCLASVRISQNKPEEAKQFVEQAWATWSHLELDNPLLPPIPSRLSLARLFLELSLYPPAMTVIQGILASDDQEVEAWYLEGWCFNLMASHARDTGEKIENLGWDELARDALDCLEACETLHVSQEHPDDQILQHVKELIAELKKVGVTPTPAGDDTGSIGGSEYEDEDGDVEMA